MDSMLDDDRLPEKSFERDVGLRSLRRQNSHPVKACPSVKTIGLVQSRRPVHDVLRVPKGHGREANDHGAPALEDAVLLQPAIQRLLTMAVPPTTDKLFTDLTFLLPGVCPGLRRLSSTLTLLPDPESCNVPAVVVELAEIWRSAVILDSPKMHEKGKSLTRRLPEWDRDLLSGGTGLGRLLTAARVVVLKCLTKSRVLAVFTSAASSVCFASSYSLVVRCR